MAKVIVIEDMTKFVRLFPEMSYTNVWTYSERLKSALDNNDIRYTIRESETDQRRFFPPPDEGV